MKLRTRLFTSHVGLVTSAVALTGACALVSFHSYVVNSLRADLRARTTALAASVSERLAIGDHRAIEAIVARHGAQPDVWIRVFSEAGALSASSSPEADRSVNDWRTVPGVAAALGGTVNDGVWHNPGTDDDRLYVAEPLVRDGRVVGAIRVSRTLESLKQQDRQAMWTIMPALLLVLAASVVASRYLSRALAAPIARMRNFAVSIGDGRLGARLEVESHDELGELGKALNAMSERLATIDEERRTFLARASHELRTPVTNVYASLEALESGASEDPQLRTRFLSTALFETRRMANLIGQLLDLGRLEAGASVLEPRPLDLRRLIDQAVQSVAVRFEAAGVELRVDSSDVSPTDGDPERIQQVLLNLLENALTFSPTRTTVRISLNSVDGCAVVKVVDEGAGFAPAELPHVFREFFTSSGGRSVRGTGLGLSIARRIINAHGGTISAENGAASGAVVQIRLPHRIAPALSSRARTGPHAPARVDSNR